MSLNFNKIQIMSQSVKYALIVAGGKGLRMGNDLPKQFIELAGKPVLMRTIEAFYNFDKSISIILVLPDQHKTYWKNLCDKFNFQIKHQVADGGETRFDSVKNGLALTGESGLVAIHDGVRPLVSDVVINDCYIAAEKFGAALPVVAVIDSMRVTTDDASLAVNREKYRLVQTPQVFEIGLIKRAYQNVSHKDFTDDATVAESIGHKIKLVQGSRENIKITTPLDLIIAEAIINQKEN